MSETSWLDISSNQAVDSIHDRMMRNQPIVPTGLPMIDKAIWGFGDRRGIPQGTYAIIGGASNIGKTQFGLHLLRQAAKSEQRACFLCYDMKREYAIMRLHQAIAGDAIPFTEWMPSRWKPEYQQTLRDALRSWRMSYTDGGIAIWTQGGRSVEHVRASVREGVDAGATFFVIDHLQKIRVSGFGDDAIASRAEVVSETMDELAETYGVTIIALSQLNRWATKDRNRQPTMQDLWGGTAMESNSELVFILDHSRYERDEKKHHLGRTWILFDKNQLGPKGFSVPVLCNHATLNWDEAREDQVDDWPQHVKTNGRK